MSDLGRLLLQVVSILGVARALSPLSRRLGQPLVIAEIAAGIVLGPTLLGWLSPEVSRWLFPVGSLGGLRVASELGLLLFMFLVGLSVDGRRLEGRARTAGLVGLASLLVPLVSGAALAALLVPSYAGDREPLRFVAFFAAAMAVTAFPVLARILSERHLLATRVGALALACAAVDDLFAWVLVTILFAVGAPDGGWESIALAALGLVAGVAILVVLRSRVPAMVAQADRAGPGAGAVTAALLGLLAAVAAWEALGIPALFGAFLFGALFPRPSGLVDLLVDRLETVTHVVLLPLFFAYTGLRMELGAIDSGHDLWALGAIVVVASASKIGGAALVARLTGLAWREAAGIGALLNTRGLVGLVVLHVGLDRGAVTPTVFSMLVIMALVTTAMTGPLLRWLYPDRAWIAERVAEPDPPRDEGRVETLIACVADASGAPGLASVARALAADDGARVVALHLTSIDTDDPAAPDDEPAALSAFGARARALDLLTRSVSFDSTDPATDIVRIAEAKRASFLLLGAHRPWWLEGRLDGVVGAVLGGARATVGVLVGADRLRGDAARILCAYGGEEDAFVLALARRLARRAEATITVLPLVPLPEGRSRGALRALPVARAGAPFAALREAAQPGAFDLIVVPYTRTWGPSGDRFGRERRSLYAQLELPLLVVRAGRDPAQYDLRETGEP